MDIPTVRLLPNQAQKYIVVDAVIGGKCKQVLHGNPDAQWHNDILKELTDVGIKVTGVYGGGRLFVNSDKKEIYVWGTSDRFGPAPRPLVEELLEAEFADYVLKFNQEPAQ